MKVFVFIALFLALAGGSYWGYRTLTGASDSAAVESPEETKPELVKPADNRPAAIPVPGALAPGQVPTPRDGSEAPSAARFGAAAGSEGGDAAANAPLELDKNGLPKFENTGPDGRLNLGEADNGATDPFRPDGRDAAEAGAYSDLPPPPPPRVAEDGAGDPAQFNGQFNGQYDGGDADGGY